MCLGERPWTPRVSTLDNFRTHGTFQLLSEEREIDGPERQGSMKRSIAPLLLISLLLTAPPVAASPIPPESELWVMDADGTGQRMVFDLGYTSSEPASWSPDSSRLVVSGLSVIDVNTGEARSITSGRRPDWSPTGNDIVFSDTVSNPSSYDEKLYLINSDGSDRRLLVDTPGLDSNPVWSPDGTQVAFISGAGSGQGGRVSVVNADGTGLRQVSSANALYTPPAWSPDGTEIAFQTFNYVLHIVGTDGSNERAVSADDYSHSPTWCPDGTLYFAAQPEPESGVGVYALNEDGTRSFVTRGIPSDCAPSGHLTFVRDRDVHIIDPDAAGTPNLTNSENRSDVYPSWSPGGEMIAFISTPDLPDPIVVERNIRLSLRKHLFATGRVVAESQSCVAPMTGIGVKIQKLSESGWRTLKKVRPDSEGRFRVDLKDRRGFYRAVAPHTYSEFGEAECLRAVSNLERHRH